eukprot:4520919-Alexandrium_andersonii.AAC.1
MGHLAGAGPADTGQVPHAAPRDLRPLAADADAYSPRGRADAPAHAAEAERGTTFRLSFPGRAASR